MKPLRRIVRAILAILSWLTAATAFLVVLSALGAVSPALSHMAPFAALLVVTIGVADTLLRLPDRFALRRAALLGISVALLALLLPDIRGYAVGLMSQPALRSSGAIRLVELNVWDLNPDRARTIAWLRKTQADVIVLAEAREPFIADLVRIFPDYQTQVTCSARPYCGVVILSRLPGRLLSGGWWVADGLKHSQPLKQDMALAAVELSATDSSGRIRRIPVVAVHLDRNGLSGVTENQVDALLGVVRAVESEAAPNLILAGDFNASPWSPQVRRLDRSIHRVSVFDPTWPSGFSVLGVAMPPVLAIDHVYLDRGWGARQLVVGPDVGSDHRPLLASLDAMPEGSRD